MGGNAQGKSNLIEAIYYLSHLKSKRSTVNSNLVMEGESTMVLMAEVFNGTQKVKIRVEVNPGGRNFEINGRKAENASIINSIVKTVLFYPEDLLIIKEGPSLRRDYLDETVEEVKPAYSETLSRYRHVVKQRNAILKDWERQGSRLKEVLNPWSESMIDLGSIIIEERMKVIEIIEKSIMKYYGFIAGVDEKINIEYQPTFSLSGPLKENMRKAIEETCEEEKRLRMTVVGPHRDVVEIKIKGMNARVFASQGEQRTISLCMRLSQRDYIVEKTGKMPVLLLDDVLSELDSERRKRAVESAEAGGQIFVTTTAEGVEGIQGNASFFEVKNGEIRTAGA